MYIVFGACHHLLWLQAPGPAFEKYSCIDHFFIIVSDEVDVLNTNTNWTWSISKVRNNPTNFIDNFTRFHMESDKRHHNTGVRLHFSDQNGQYISLFWSGCHRLEDAVK